MKNKINLFLVIGIMLLAALGCSVQSDGDKFVMTSANLSDLKFGTDKEASQPTETFSPTDKIYIVSKINNTMGGHKVRVRLLFDGVKGRESGSPVTDWNFEVPDEGTFNCSVSPKTGKFPVGRYKAEAVLFDKEGEIELDRKVGTFNVGS